MKRKLSNIPPRLIAPGPRLNTDGVLGLGRISVAWPSETISYGRSQSLEPRSDASANSTTGENHILPQGEVGQGRHAHQKGTAGSRS